MKHIRLQPVAALLVLARRQLLVRARVIIGALRTIPVTTPLRWHHREEHVAVRRLLVPVLPRARPQLLALARDIIGVLLIVNATQVQLHVLRADIVEMAYAVQVKRQHHATAIAVEGQRQNPNALMALITTMMVKSITLPIPAVTMARILTNGILPQIPYAATAPANQTKL